ncbi:MAG: DUF2842 domain-containing protein [Caulobacteraceae bacterium]
MGARTRKLIGSIAVMVYLLLYVLVALGISQRLMDNKLMLGLFCAVAGILWGAPLLPLISWMNRGK